MKNTKQTFKLIYDFISKTKEEDLLKLISGDYELKIDKPSRNKEKIKKEKTKPKKEKKVIIVDNNEEINSLFMNIKKAVTRKEAKGIIEQSGFTVPKLKIVAKLFEIKIPSKMTKDKIIDTIVDIAVGEKEDENLIKSIRI